MPSSGVDRLTWLIGLFPPQRRLTPFAVFLALAAQQGGTLLTGMIAFYLLGQEEYGRTASALAFLNIFVALGSVSSSVMAYRFTLMHVDNRAMQFRILRFARSAVCVSAAIVAATVLSLLWLNPASAYLKSILPTEVLAALGFLVASVLVSYQQGYVLARGETMPLLCINLLLLVFTVPVSYWLIARWGYSGYFSALFLPLFLRGFILYLREPRADPDESARSVCFAWRQALLGFMLPATAAGLTTLPSYWLATEVLFRIPKGAAAFGLMTLGISVKQAPMLLATSLISSSGRSVFQAFAERSPTAVALHRRLFRRVIAPLIAGAALVAGLAGLTLVSIELTDLRRDAAIVTTALGVVLMVEVLNAFVYMPVNMGGMMWRSLLFIALPKDAGFVLVSVVAIATLGWIGFLIALIAWNVLGVVFTVAVCRTDPALAPFFTFARTATNGDTHG